MGKTPFIITIDTEGDNLWERPRVIKSENAKFIPRFQKLCQSFGFKPVYLTNFEMASDLGFVEAAGAWQADGLAEVGMHLHAWNSPPLTPLTGDDYFHHPYLIEYSDALMEDKIAFMTELLTRNFKKAPISHRAGRWATDQRYFRLLKKYGYLVDCSVTPHVSWATTAGSPQGSGGTDYRGFPERPYLTPEGLWEVPMTIAHQANGPILQALMRIPKVSGVIRRLHPSEVWLRPNGFNLKSMVNLAQTKAVQNGYLEFMIHSSEFMPGGSPYFKSKSDVERLYRHLEIFFEVISDFTTGMTLEMFVGERLMKT